MSLKRFHTPAAVIAFQHFHDSLANLALSRRTCETPHAVCNQLWEQMKKTLHNGWHQYGFLERYLARTGK